MVAGLKYENAQGKINDLADDVQRWERLNNVLFREGVLSRLGPPVDSPSLESFEIGMNLPPAFYSLLRHAHAGVRSGTGQGEIHTFRADHVAHFLRTDITQPQIFLTASSRPTREIFKACEAKALFAYILPKTEGLLPEQILEVRAKVKDTREGFSLHLQKLSKDVEARLKGDDSLDGILEFSRSVIETQLIPDYREFVRQLSAERAGFWSKVLDAGSKALQIDAAPWTPKFYGELMKALGLTALVAQSEKKQRLTNVSQAYQFMYQVQRYVG